MLLSRKTKKEVTWIYKALKKVKMSDAGVNGTLVIQALSDNILLIRREFKDLKKKSLIPIFNFGQHYEHLNFTTDSDIFGNINIELSRLNSFHKNW